MPQISLNITLTDEQYRELMEKSFDAISEDVDVISAVKEVVVKNMEEYLKSHAELMERCFYSYNPHYGWKENHLNNSTAQIVKDAAKDCTEQLKGVITDYMMDLAKSSELDNYLHSILLEAILKGCAAGLDGLVHQVMINQSVINNSLITIKDRLNITD